jgi:thiol:disulfide interchange protein DsbC
MRKCLLNVLMVGLFLSGSVAMAAESYDKIKARVVAESGKEPTSIKPSPIKDLYEVTIGSQIFYLSEDGKYHFSGDIIDLDTKQNVTDEKRDSLRKAALDAFGEKNMIVFGPKVPKHTITVFTDIDCGYCRKLHNEIADYTKLGIKVRYLAFPRAGLASESYTKAVSVWCADDRQKAMTNAKQGGNLPTKTCDNPVAAEYALGQELGVTGTPALVLENGKIYPGYAPAKQLFDILEKIKTGKDDKKDKK